ncbi:unnamed protein product [Sphagnum jensenii]|uniref:Glycine-rich protein n=1 Tax=Sphagnum jensenii TaxID=128206 RepID=A0ABP0X946_9BRYO
MGGGGEDFDMGFDRFPMGPGDVVGGPQELGRGFPPSCHPGGPGPAFGGPEFLNFGPMDGPACGMGMGFPERPRVSNGRMPPARNGMIMGPPPAMMGGSLMMGTAGRPLHLPMARGPTKPMGMPFRPAFGPGRKGQ